MSTKQPNLLGVNLDYLEQGGDLVMKNTQHITQAFLDDLKDSRNESSSKKEGELMRAASIPVAVVDQWTREGFNIYEATGKEIIKRLRDQNRDYFLATEKRI